jgi:hypothetical protein
MKRIVLRVLPDPQMPNVPQAEIRSAEVIRNVVRQPLDKQKGADIEEMRRGIHILDALDSATTLLELDEGDYDHLKEKLLAMQWGVVDKRLLQIIDDVLGATTHISINGIVSQTVIE